MAAALNGRPGGHGELFRSRSRASLRDAWMAESKRNIFRVTARQICVLAAADFCVILRVSLHFSGAASKLTLLYLCKGNALRCFLYGIM
jgi:hypothetical protein